MNQIDFEVEKAFIIGELKQTLSCFSQESKAKQAEFNAKINAVAFDTVELLRLIQQSVNVMKIENDNLRRSLKRLNKEKDRISQIDIFDAGKGA